jgi:hypothetical protein
MRGGAHPMTSPKCARTAGGLTTPLIFSAQVLRRFAPIPYQIGEFRG